MRIYAIKIFEKPVVIKRFEHRGNKPLPKPMPSGYPKPTKINKFI